MGAALGGGVGRYQGLHGLISDTLQSVKMVTATGDLITVSADEHADLFWGIRGAGFNYGVVIEATFEVYELTNGGNLFKADFMFPASANETYFRILASYGTLPARLSLFTVAMMDPYARCKLADFPSFPLLLANRSAGHLAQRLLCWQPRRRNEPSQQIQ